MDESTFWSLVEDAHERSHGDMERKCVQLRTQLEALATQELLSFIEHFDARMDEAYSWDLWGTAFVIGRGCGDDSFSDFRSTLISCGRRLFDRTLSDPDSLADNGLTADPFFEGFGYVGFETYRRRTGRLPMRKSRWSAQTQWR
jgi:hypothetical protein